VGLSLVLAVRVAGSMARLICCGLYPLFLKMVVRNLSSWLRESWSQRALALCIICLLSKPVGRFSTFLRCAVVIFSEPVINRKGKSITKSESSFSADDCSLLSVVYESIR
jgi:hypothetical protein